MEFRIVMDEAEVRRLVGVDWSPGGPVGPVVRQIEAQMPKPKPVEPTGLGAVVEDANGLRWVKARDFDHALNWRSCPAGMWRPFAEIDAVKLLSEGVAQ